MAPTATAGLAAVIAGHFGFAAMVKARERQVPLWALMLASVWLDIVFVPLYLTGIETIALAPGTHGGYASAIIHADYTHSLVGAALLAVVFGTSMSMHDERDWGTLARLLVAPGGFTRILLGKLAARFVVGVLQMLILLAWGHYVFGVSLGSSPIAFVLLTMAAVFAVVAAGMLVAGLARSREQTLPLGLSLVMALSALGGCWWPQSMQPDWMNRISPVVFTTWAMRGLNDLILRERGLDAVALPVGVLLAYGAVTMALGLRLFRMRFSAR